MQLGPYRFSPRPLPTLATVLGLAALLACGFWQLERAQEKGRAIAMHSSARTAATIRVTADSATDQSIGPEMAPGARLVALGQYDARRQYLLDNRTHDGRAGYHVLTPLRLGSDRGVLVNRGWVPSDGRRDVLPDVALSPAREPIAVIQGRAAPPREDQLVLGESGYEQAGGWPRVVQRIELDAMAGQLGYPLLAVVLRLDPAAPDGYVRDWQPHLGLTPEKHRAYAFQWFALATALLVIFVVVNASRDRGAA